jgi:hypothetical protein
MFAFTAEPTHDVTRSIKSNSSLGHVLGELLFFSEFLFEVLQLIFDSRHMGANFFGRNA